MSGLRGEVLEWLAEGCVRPGWERQALLRAGLLPGPGAWREFLARLCLWLGTGAIAAALIFFLAYNWDDLGRFAKFGLAEGAILIALLACWRADLDGPAGKAILVLLALLTGALLALTGQVYQTGADTYELFGWWAALILPWVLVGRFSPLWLLWIALLDLTVILYFERGWSDGNEVLWCLLGLNSLALAAWEAAHRRGVSWLRDSWPPRLLALAALFAATSLAFGAIFASHASGLRGLAYLMWLGAFLSWYLVARRDLFMLAGALLSLIVTVAAWLAIKVLSGGAGSLLFIGLVVIAMSAGGAMGLRSLAREEQA
jgi:uncharacterized membrane protein